MPYPCAGRPARRRGVRARHAMAGITVVAVAARRLVDLPEVLEQERAPAAAALRVGAHHLDPRAVEGVPALIGLLRLRHGLAERRSGETRSHAPVGAHLDAAR